MKITTTILVSMFYAFGIYELNTHSLYSTTNHEKATKRIEQRSVHTPKIKKPKNG